MTTGEDGPLSCDTVSDELPALLYDDLDPALKRRVEQHLETCDKCRAELEGHRRTVRMLDDWSIVPPAERAQTPKLAQSRVPISRWVRPVIVGAAAAVVAFAALSLFGISVESSNGRLTLSLGRGRPQASLNTKATSLDPTADLNLVVMNAVDARVSMLVQALEADLAELGRREERQRTLLVRAVDKRCNADLHRFAAAMDTLARRQDEETRRGLRFQDDLNAWRGTVDGQLSRVSSPED